jgi:hypothetical protein
LVLPVLLSTPQRYSKCYRIFVHIKVGGFYDYCNLTKTLKREEGRGKREEDVNIDLGNK